MTLLMLVGGAFAADHIDGPAAAADPAVDISDLFAWYENGRLIVALDFAGAGATTGTGFYDADTLYGIHIDTDGDPLNGAERDVWCRFGQDALGNWGLQVTNFPGTGAPVSGPVESVITAPGGKIFAGVRNDPFTFDFAGFLNAVANEDLTEFTGADFFAGLNVTSIVLDMDGFVAADGGDNVRVWATSARLP